MKRSQLWEQHRRKWSKCKACELHQTREQVVLLRGKIPCDILFCGEAPGTSEDTLGQPFVGPAGHLLDKMIVDAIPPNTRLAFTNLVACIPLDVDGNKVHEPHKDHIHECSDRLVEIYRLCDPDAVVMVGKLAEKYVPKLLGEEGRERRWKSIIHPAAILRMDVTQKGLAVQQTIVRLADLADELVPF